MKLLIFDTIFPIGHKDLNNKLIGLLSGISELMVLNKAGYYSGNRPANVKIRTCKLLLPVIRNVLVNQCCQLWNFLAGFLTVLPVRYDKVLFFTFDTVGFAIARFLFAGKESYLFHHRNTAELSNKYKRKIFLSYANSVNHIVFTEFIKDYLVNELHVTASRVFVLPHPLILPEEKEPYNSNMEKLFVGLGYANDERMIKEIVQQEAKDHILENRNIRLILRSKEWAYEGKAIKVIKGHLKREEYDRYFNAANAILLLYPESYKNRFSGAIMDAFIHKKVVIGTNIPIVGYFAAQYPGSCMIVGSTDDLFRKIKNFQSPSVIQLEKERSIFFQRHSDQTVLHKLKQIINE